MSDKTGIEWTGVTWNPSTGCDRISEGCDNCYALTMARRLKAMGSVKYQRDGDPRTSGPGFGVAVHEDALLAPLHWREPEMVFVNSMSDLFHKEIPDAFIAEVFSVMARAQRHTFQVLTKRHARMKSLLSRPSFRDNLAHWGQPWPLPNVWLGVSAEDQHWANLRIPALLHTPAAVRFVSAEPLLGPIDLMGKTGSGCEDTGPAITHHGYSYPVDYGTGVEHDCEHEAGIDWLIAGGESSPGARPMHPDWARKLRDQCQAHDVPFFFKQHGEWGPAPWRVDREPGETDDAYKARAEELCATHAYAPWAHQYEHEPHKAGHKPWSLERGTLPPEQAPIRRWGKGRSGRLLDGREWSEFPRVPVEAS